MASETPAIPKRWDLVCLGHATLDRIHVVDAIPSRPTKAVARSLRVVGGGMAANAACAAARLGGSVAFWGRAGTDAAGRLIADELAACGVDVGGFVRVEGAASSESAVLVDPAGERLIVNFPGTVGDDVGALPLQRVGEARCVLVDVRLPESALALLQAARAACVPSVLDADVAERAVLDRLLREADHVVFSTEGLCAWSGGAAVDAALATALSAGPRDPSGRVIGVTLGAGGSAWRTAAGRAFRVGAPVVAAVDTLGAGDVFHGAYALAIGEGQRLDAAIAFATAAAAIKCTRAGGRAGAPRRDEVEALLASRSEWA